MGIFYTNFTVRAADHHAVADVLRAAGRTALVAPAANGNTAVFDEACEAQDLEEIEKLGRLLSRSLDRPVIAFLNHDDDVLLFWLFKSGQVIDQYNSWPAGFEVNAESNDPSGGDAAKLCAAFDRPDAATRVEQILRKAVTDKDGYGLAIFRHKALADALGLPPHIVGGGWHDLKCGECPGDIDINEFLEVRPRTDR